MSPTQEKIKLSFVVPAYNASGTVGRALRSLLQPTVPLSPEWEQEIIVVDDGSSDTAALHDVLREFPSLRLITHEKNRGIAAARNSGIMASSGDIVTYLDADDEFIPNWPDSLRAILAEWPREYHFCLSTCLNLEGQVTVSVPNYTGPISLEDRLRERYPGEYLTLFQGEYIRSRGYFDPGMVRECGEVGYLTFLSDGPAWITAKILRIYHFSTGSSIKNWTRRDNAAQIARCYEIQLERFGKLYAEKAPRNLRLTQLRYATYLRLAGKPGAWREWRKAASVTCLPQSAMAFLMLVFGWSFTSKVVDLAKKFGIIKRYG